MTEYYPGSNIGLNYNAEEGTWNFTNQAQDFIDPSSFSTPEPSFPTAPTNGESEEEQEEFNPCPPGYKYDTSLKQCVPDPNYQAPDFLGQPSTADGDPNKDNPQAEFISFDASTESGRKAMYDHAVKKGYVNEKGELLGPPKALNIGFLTPVAQFGINRQYNRWLKELGKYDAEMKSKGLPTGFVQAIGMAPKILPRFYETTSATQLRGRDVDVSDDASITGRTETDAAIKETRDPAQTITEDQITETKAGEPVDIISDIRDSKSGTSYTDASGDTYTSTGDGGIRFEPRVSKPAVSQKTKGGVSYGTGRGGTASAQRQMKKQSTPSSAAQAFKQYERF
jgi:hypothetical protein